MLRVVATAACVAVLLALFGGGTQTDPYDSGTSQGIYDPQAELLVRFSPDPYGDVEVLEGGLVPRAHELVPDPFVEYDASTAFVLDNVLGRPVALVAYDTGTLYLAGDVHQFRSNYFPPEKSAALSMRDESGKMAIMVDFQGNLLVHGTVFVHDYPYTGRSNHVPEQPSKSVKQSGGDEVSFPDANLESVIRNAIDKPQGTIYESDLLVLTSLEGNYAGIADLTGIEYCVNLEHLFLRGNRIADIGPLGSLTLLTLLELSENPLDSTDLAPLSYLTNLERLSIGRCGIADISALASLTSLQTLSINENAITDLGPVSGMNALWYLHAPRNMISDLSAVTWSNLTSLESLSLSEQQGERKISDVGPLSTLPSITWLDLSCNDIDNVAPLGSLSTLSYLGLVDNAVADFSGLSGLSSLESLALSGNAITDMSPVADMTGLTNLRIMDNALTQIAGMDNLAVLETFALDGNRISDLGPLRNLPSTELLWTGLRNNRIVDITPLVDNTVAFSSGLIDLENNPLNQQALCVHKPALNNRGAWVYVSGHCGYGEWWLRVELEPPEGGNTNPPDEYWHQQQRGSVVDWHAYAAPGWQFSHWEGPVSDPLLPDTTITIPDRPGSEEPDGVGKVIVTAVFSQGFFTDPALEDLVRDTLRKPGQELSVEDLARLRVLIGPNAGISDLSGLEHCVNLRVLMLRNNNITDLEPLLELPNLRYVSVYGNPLSQEALCEQIPQLQEQGVTVHYSGGYIVHIPDPRLEWHLREVLDIPEDERELYREDLEQLNRFDARYDTITDLTGLEYCTNLRRLNLEYNRITDLSPLAGLTNLHRLYLAKNDITDIAPLVANTGIGHGDTVDLTDNPLTLTAICEQIPQLESRGVNVIADYHGDEVIDFPDDGLYLRIVLALPHITLGDDITLCDLEGLTRLDAASSEISDLTGLEYCWDLEYLDLSDNNVTDISPIEDLRKLTTLNLADNGIIHVDMLGDLSQLQTLDLSYNLICSAVSDLAFLQQLENLEELYLGENNVYDLVPLSGLTNLRVLDLQANELHDIDTAPLSTLTSLENLNLSFNHVRSLGWLASLDSLQHLDLTHNQLRDVAPLGHCVGLNWLSLAENNVYDLSPLTSAPVLGQGDRLDVRKNPLTPPSYADDIQGLVERGVDVEYTQSHWCEEWNRGAGLWKSADGDSVDPRCSCPDKVNVVVEPASGWPGAGQVMVFLGEPRWEIIGPTEGKIQEKVLRGTTVGVLAIANKGYGFDQWLTTPYTPVHGCEEPFVAFYAVNDTTHVEARFDSVGLSVGYPGGNISYHIAASDDCIIMDNGVQCPPGEVVSASATYHGDQDLVWGN